MSSSEWSPLPVVRVVRSTHSGGSCARCDGDYSSGGAGDSPRGIRVLARIEPEEHPDLVEPVNLCSNCFESETEVER